MILIPKGCPKSECDRWLEMLNTMRIWGYYFGSSGGIDVDDDVYGELSLKQPDPTDEALRRTHAFVCLSMQWLTSGSPRPISPFHHRHYQWATFTPRRQLAARWPQPRVLKMGWNLSLIFMADILSSEFCWWAPKALTCGPKLVHVGLKPLSFSLGWIGNVCLGLLWLGIVDGYLAHFFNGSEPLFIWCKTHWPS